MIVPMKKVSLIILGNEKEQALNELQRLGLLHIEIAEGSGEKLASLKDKMSLLEASALVLGERVTKQTNQREITADEAYALAKEVSALLDEKKALQGEQITLINELDRILAWGDIDPEKLDE